jgi:sterol desaturase/sphingolipid hydroxylase (fatty acid hydroxylase superfamily)
MDTTYGRAVAWAVPVFLTLIALELLLDRMRGERYYRLADSINSISCGVISTGMRVFFGFLAIFTYEWTYQRLAFAHLAADHWAVWLFAFVMYDFCYYWSHRLGHTVGVLWAAHVVHHQSEEFNLSTALRQAGTGSFLGWIFYIPIALCGVPLGVFLVAGVVQLFYQFWPHTRVIGRLGFLDRWVQTPSNHRVHHAQNDIYLDKNYVGVFLIWDRLFGTFQEELDSEPCIYGIRGQLKSWNPVWANLHYYVAMAKDSWRARSWTDKIKVWLARPGWRPADVGARFPKSPYDPQTDFVRFDPPRTALLSAYALVQSLVLIAVNSHFLWLLPKTTLAGNLTYFGYIVATLVILGGVLENRREFLYAEAFRLLTTALVVLATGRWFGGVHTPAAIYGILAFAMFSIAVLAFAARALPKEEAAPESAASSSIVVG